MSKRPISIFQLPFEGLKSALSDAQVEDTVDSVLHDTRDVFTCNCCGLEFLSRSIQLGHFRSLLHRQNLKRSLAGEKILSPSEFERIEISKEEEEEKEGLLEALTEEEEDEDLSEALIDEKEDEEKDEEEDEEEESMAPGSVEKTYRHNDIEYVIPPYLSSIFQSPDVTPSSFRTWCVLLLQSGRFAAALFDGVSPVAHKVFTRYTIRKKGGGAQSTKDKSKKIRSAGSQMRRQGEKRLDEDINDWLTEHADWLSQCSKIFVSYPKNMKGSLFRDSGSNKKKNKNRVKGLLDKQDERISSLPFMLQSRPSFNEILQVHAKLQLIYPSEESGGGGVEEEEVVPGVSGLDLNQLPALIPAHLSDLVRLSSSCSSLSRQSSASSTTTSNTEGGEEDGEDGVWTNPFDTYHVTMTAYDVLFSHCLSGDEEGVREVVETFRKEEEEEEGETEGQEERVQQLVADFVNLPSPDSMLMTPLHAACLASSSPSLLSLLLSLGANPTIKDGQQRLPYRLITSKACRDEVRRYRGEVERLESRPSHFPDFSWDEAGVPAAMTNASEEKKRERQKEKRKRRREKQKQQKQEERERKEREEQEQERKEEEKERRRKEKQQERRNEEEEEQCAYCRRLASSLPANKVMLTHGDDIFCSAECLKQHRRELMARAAEDRLQG